MKKVLALALSFIFALPIISGCNGNKKPPAVGYTTEILINQETLPKDLTWYVDLDSPTAGKGIVEIPNYSTYATFDTADIFQTTQRDYRDILDFKAPFEDTIWQKIGFFFQSGRDHKNDEYRLKVLGMTSEVYDQKIKKYIDLNDFNYYNDRVIGIIYPVIYQGETEETTDAEYSNKNILVDYDYTTSVVIPYTDEELKAENGGLYSSSYVGRIGERYYLTYGYYDLTTRKLCSYKDENDLPPFNETLGIKDGHDLLRIIKNDPEAKEYISDNQFIISYNRLGDRYYAVINDMNRYYGNSIDDYEGENVFFATVDAVTGDVLYLQKFHLENYWGYEYKLLSHGEDGILYDIMLP